VPRRCSSKALDNKGHVSRQVFNINTLGIIVCDLERHTPRDLIACAILLGHEHFAPSVLLRRAISYMMYISKP